MNTVPFSGSGAPTLICALSNASPTKYRRNGDGVFRIQYSRNWIETVGILGSYII